MPNYFFSTLIYVVKYKPLIHLSIFNITAWKEEVKMYTLEKSVQHDFALGGRSFKATKTAEIKSP